MKIWDVLEVLSENPESTFKNLRFGGVLGYLQNGTLGWISNSNHDGEPFSIHCVMNNERYMGNWNDDWELVPQEVPWREALGAWLDGEEVYFIDVDNRKRRIGECNLFIDNCVFVNKKHFTESKWFIK